MKYYTPELFERCNSSNFDQAFAASQEWEAGIALYERDLATWLEIAPEGIRRLFYEFSGHDGKFLGQNLIGRGVLCLLVQADQSLWKLNYQLVADSPKVVSPPRQDNTCWSHGPIPGWLYDELSFVSPSHYRHEILREDGSVLQVDFSDVLPILSRVPRVNRFERRMLPSTTAREIARAFRHRTTGMRKQPARSGVKQSKGTPRVISVLQGNS